MDKKSQLDKLEKLFKMNPDPPTEFPKTQCLNRPITYREACIDYVKKTMRCVNYRDYVVAELEKLDKIEQIINYGSKENGISSLNAIREVLEHE